jgi:hypothetical protein
MSTVYYRRLPFETDDWDSYDGELQGEPVSILVNLSAITRAPAPDKPWRLRISTHSLAARIAVSSGKERPFELYALLNLLATDRPAVELVGGVTSLAYREFYYYATSSEGVKSAVDSVRSRFPHYCVKSRCEQDAQWQLYREVLYPTEPRMMHQIRNRRVLRRLHTEGDDHTVVRPVDHDVYFRTAADSVYFVRAVKDLGFRARSGPGQRMQTQCERPFFVNVVRSDPVTPGHITGIVTELLLLACRFDGQYDGWGCGVRTGGLPKTRSQNADSGIVLQ